MTAPHNVSDFDGNATHSDTTSETNLISSVFSASPIAAAGNNPPVSTTNQLIGFSSSQVGPLPLQAAYSSGNLGTAGAHTHSTPLPNGRSLFDPTLHQSADNQSDTINHTLLRYTTHTSPGLTNFDSRARTARYLHFAPQPQYEPTGELVNEQFDDFFEFGSLSINRSSIHQHAEQPPVEVGEAAKSISSGPHAISEDQSQGFKIPDAPTRPKSALKRKVDQSELGVNGHIGEKVSPRRAVQTRSVSFERMSTHETGSPEETHARSATAQARAPTANPHARRGRPSLASSVPKPSIEFDKPTPSGGTSRPIRGTTHPSGHPPSILPPEKVFPIQIGSDLFRLSGASISSDAPSYFTQFFEEQIRENSESGGVRTLYIDRDPITFRDVARHLQGYYVKPQDGSHFVKLFADAQFYSLPRLIDQLFESEIFIQIGERHFQIPKDIFSEPGNSPNFFSLGFAVFFSTPGEVFPGLDRRGLLRPPSITPPYVPNRSADIFAELLHLLRGYPLNIRNENHRQELLRDCRYFHLRGLEQKIIAHDITYNLRRSKHEIAIRLEDVKPSGVAFRPSDSDDDDDSNDGAADDSGKGDDSDSSSDPMVTDATSQPKLKKEARDSHLSQGWVYYARPFVDEVSYELVVEIGNESTEIDMREMRADFHGLTKARISSLLQVVANKMNLPTNAPLGLLILGQAGAGTQESSPGHTPLSEDRVKVKFEQASAVTLDGKKWEVDLGSAAGRRMRLGPDVQTQETEQKDAIESDVEESVEQQHQSRQRQTQQQGQQVTTPSAIQPKSKITTTTQQRLPIAPIDTTSGKKRKRPGATSSVAQPPQHGSAVPTARKPSTPPMAVSELNETWTVRTGQFRLRIQANPNDRIRGGLEVVFVVVKIDAWRGEKARNERRGFLGG